MPPLHRTLSLSLFLSLSLPLSLSLSLSDSLSLSLPLYLACSLALRRPPRLSPLPSIFTSFRNGAPSLQNPYIGLAVPIGLAVDRWQREVTGQQTSHKHRKDTNIPEIA